MSRKLIAELWVVNPNVERLLDEHWPECRINKLFTCFRYEVGTNWQDILTAAEGQELKDDIVRRIKLRLAEDIAKDSMMRIVSTEEY